MRALDKKLGRDLLALWGQVLTIALVMACGVASYVALRSAFSSIERSRVAYYDAQRFPDVFARLRRAPSSLEARVAALPGVSAVETRVVDAALVPLPGLSEPARGRVISLPRDGGPRLADVHLRRGRLPEPGHDEAVLVESFADAHAIDPGARLTVVMGGVARTVHVVGVVMSPEYVFSVNEGELVQDAKRFAILWMPRSAVAPAYAMEGAFNDVVLRLQRGADEKDVISRLDTLLAPYGGFGAHARDRQLSHMVLTQELGQLESFATVAPVIFLAVAAFLVNVVISRTVNLQRTQIAVLKAVGYSNREVAAHYLGMVSVISALGGVLGVALGAYLGRGMLDMYRPHFRFPEMRYTLEPRLVVIAVVISVGAATLGTLATAWRVARLPPAEAMTPAAPPVYRRSLFERLGLARVFGTSARMVIRELSRHPLRTVSSVFGVALAIAILIVARFSHDGVTAFLDAQFRVARREDVEVTLRRPVTASVVNELRRLPGVRLVEPVRSVAVRARAGQRARDAILSGRPRASELNRIVEWPVRVVPLPERGLLVSAELAAILRVRPGDVVVLEPYEGGREPRSVPIAGVVDDVFGLSLYGTHETVSQILREEPTITSVLMTTDGDARDGPLLGRLKEIPMVAGVTRRRSVIERLDAQMGDTMWITMGVMTAFAVAIAVGVIYNNARIALSMRARDLASLRVLGYTRREVTSVLVGELAAYVALAIGPGFLLGRFMCEAMMSTVDRELYRFPTVISERTYAFSVLVTALTAAVSAVLVWRKVVKLDLTAVLKTRE